MKTLAGLTTFIYPGALRHRACCSSGRLVVKGFNVPAVLLPAPSAIWAKLITSLPILWVDFVQTVLRAVIPGWIIGSLSGFLVAILCDRIPFLRRGLLPLGNLVAALPIVGIAPIMVMWFGFDWQSKAAVVVVMTFFPMLVNTVAGLAAPSGHLERDLMRTYGASLVADAGQAAAAGRHALHLQRAQDQLDPGPDRRHRGRVLRHADRRHGLSHLDRGRPAGARHGLGRDRGGGLAGSAFYGLLALLERAVTFWHPSYRR